MQRIATQTSSVRAPAHRRAMLWLAGLALAGGALTMATPARAQEASSGEQLAVAGQIADVGTTGLGLIAGAAEANPLGLLTLGAKWVAYQQIKQAPAEEQPGLWKLYGAFGWGAAANNLCVIAAIATGGAAAPLCPVIGLAAGVGAWQREQTASQSVERLPAMNDLEAFAMLCEQARSQNPSMECVWRPS